MKSKKQEGRNGLCEAVSDGGDEKGKEAKSEPVFPLLMRQTINGTMVR
jgi:hypothetical protein